MREQHLRSVATTAKELAGSAKHETQARIDAASHFLQDRFQQVFPRPQETSVLDYPKGKVLPPWFASEFAVALFMERYVSEFHVDGLLSLDRAYRLMRDGNAIVFAGNHGSNGDGPFAARAIRDTASVSSDRMKPVFPVGKKLLDDPKTKFLTRSLPTIPVWPPTIKPETSAMRREFKEMNDNALLVSETVLRSDDNRVIVIFPEGTRTRTGQLLEGNAAVARYFQMAHSENGVSNLPPKNDTYIVPFVIQGADIVYPVNSKFPAVRGPVSVTFLEPLSVRGLADQYKDMPKMQQQQQIVDHVMIDIAQQLPPDRRGHYADRRHA
jgi:1-acyl-sn-glycerol-3-phosphate acyltransferase